METRYNRLKVLVVVKGSPREFPVAQYAFRVAGAKVKLKCEGVDGISRFKLIVQTQDKSRKKSTRSPQLGSQEVIELEA